MTEGDALLTYRKYQEKLWVEEQWVKRGEEVWRRERWQNGDWTAWHLTAMKEIPYYEMKVTQ